MKANPFIAFLAAAGLGFAASATAQEPANFCETGFLPGDINEDGKIDAGEVEVLRSGEFESLDADGDGTVTREEFELCLAATHAVEVAPRDVSVEGVETELEELEDGTLARTEFTEAAERTFDATRNEEDNPIAWARNFIVLPPDTPNSEIAEMSRDEFAARAAAMFRRLDADGSGDLSTDEWETEETPAVERSGVAESFDALDEDDSGDLSQAEYLAAGSDQAARAREAAIARGWGEGDAMAGGVEADDEAGEVTSQEAEGLVTEGGALAAEDAAEAEAPADATPEDAASAEGEPADGAPVFDYRFEEG